MSTRELDPVPCMTCDGPATFVVYVTIKLLISSGNDVGCRSGRSYFCPGCLKNWSDQGAAQLRDEARAAGIAEPRGLASHVAEVQLESKTDDLEVPQT